MTNSLLDAALYWHKMGIATIPIKYRDKRPDGSKVSKWEPYQTQLPTELELRTWFTGRLHNLGVVVGWKNLIVVDFDLNDGDYTSWRLWVARQSRYIRHLVNDTYQVMTGRGYHFYFTTLQPETNRKLSKIDIKAQGGYVLAPPSIHPSGRAYRELTPGAVPLGINVLSDILPSNFLVQNTPLPTDIVIPSRAAAPQKILSSDPWDAAQNVNQPSEDVISEIRARFRVEDFFPQAEYSSSNRRWMLARCPFHADKHPSFWLDTQRQICSCHSGCTPKPLDVINLYARLYSLSNLEAIYSMARML